MQKALKVIISNKELSATGEFHFAKTSDDQVHTLTLKDTSNERVIVLVSINKDTGEASLDYVGYHSVVSNIYVPNYGESSLARDINYEEYRAAGKVPADLLILLLNKRLIEFCFMKGIETLSVGDSQFTYCVTVNCG